MNISWGGKLQSTDKTSLEVPIFSKFIGFSDIPNELYALSKDKCFREKDSFLPNWISF